jgi:hypothetical protein
MDSTKRFAELSECINRAIQDYLTKTNVAWPSQVEHPVLRVEAFIEDDAHEQMSPPLRSLQIASVCMM